jgi:fructokinase
LSVVVSAFGEALWDMLPAGAKLGGASLNFIYRIQTLGHRGVLMSRLGRDDLGERALAKMSDLGMVTDHIQWDEARPTGIVNVTLDESKTPDFDIVQDVAYDYIQPSDSIRRVVDESECLYCGTLIQRAKRSRNTLYELLERFSGRYALVDVNLRKNCYTGETVRASLQRADILKLSEQEVAEVADMAGLKGASLTAFMRDLFDKSSAECCVVTLGTKGAFAASREGELVYEPTYEVAVEDTTGSGDAFTAGFLHGLLSGASLAAACRFGNALGALVAAREGGTHVVSTEAVETMIERGKREAGDPRLEAYRG